jgi:hypothetical protein
MNATTRLLLSVALAAAAASQAIAAERMIATPTGFEVACSEVDSIRFKDMPRLYGVDNYAHEYQDYVRFRVLAARACTGERVGDALADRPATNLLLAGTVPARLAR